MSNSMTNEEAIRILDPDCKEVWQGGDGVDACRVAVKALKKQIPKKPEQGNVNAYNYICPTCGATVGDREIEEIWCSFCPNCGQAIDKSLDWSDTNVR